MKKSSGCVELEGLGIEQLDIANDQVGEMGKTRSSGCDSDTVMEDLRRTPDLGNSFLRCLPSHNSPCNISLPLVSTASCIFLICATVLSLWDGSDGSPHSRPHAQFS